MLLVIGVSVLLFAAGALQFSRVRPLGLSTHRLHFGGAGIGSAGWLMPANTSISTSHSAGQSLSGFIEATLNVFPYKIQPGTVLYLSLYTNDHFVANQEYDLSGTYQTPATMTRMSGTGVADFSDSMLGFTVSQMSLNTALPAGTKVTVVTWVSNPIWVQVDSTSLTQSYEAQGVTTYSPPSVIIANSGTITPYTLSVGFESAAE
jgi:hypothetical protein